MTLTLKELILELNKNGYVKYQVGKIESYGIKILSNSFHYLQSNQIKDLENCMGFVISDNTGEDCEYDLEHSAWLNGSYEKWFELKLLKSSKQRYDILIDFYNFVNMFVRNLKINEFLL